MSYEIAYYPLLFAIYGMLLFGWNKTLKRGGTDDKQRTKRLIKTIALLVIWQVYTAVISGLGILQDFSLPPRMPIFLIFPAFAFIIWWLTRSANRQLMNHISPQWPIFFQTFRIFVELLIHGLFLKGLAPESVTFEGYNYEIVAGATAPIIAWLIYKQPNRKGLAIAWNFAGLGTLAIVVGLFVTSAFFPAIWGSETSLVQPEMGSYPYMMIPSIYMPVAVMMHIVSIMQLRSGRYYKP